MRDFQFFTVSCGGPVNHSDVYPSGKTFTWSAAAGKRVSLLSPVVGFLFNRPTPVFIYSPPLNHFISFLVSFLSMSSENSSINLIERLRYAVSWSRPLIVHCNLVIIASSACLLLLGPPTLCWYSPTPSAWWSWFLCTLRNIGYIARTERSSTTHTWDAL